MSITSSNLDYAWYALTIHWITMNMKEQQDLEVEIVAESKAKYWSKSGARAPADVRMTLSKGRLRAIDRWKGFQLNLGASNPSIEFARESERLETQAPNIWHSECATRRPWTNPYTIAHSSERDDD